MRWSPHLITSRSYENRPWQRAEAISFVIGVSPTVTAYRVLDLQGVLAQYPQRLRLTRCTIGLRTMPQLKKGCTRHGKQASVVCGFW
jgi:hypothetical protein